MERAHPLLTAPNEENVRMHPSITGSVAEADRSAPFDHLHIEDDRLPELGPGAVHLAVERFSLAANNLTYVLLADVLHSWNAFPSPRPGRGRVPVWGIARVLAADPSVATIGTRLSGYLPMATHVAVHGTAQESGLLTTDEPRTAMLPIYRRLTDVGTDAAADERRADVETVLLPVCPFAALLADDLTRAGARSVVVSSASSRSAAALSRLLGTRGVEVTGLTSTRNRSAVESLGVYTHVATYDGIDRIPDSRGTAYVDVAGSAEVTSAVHQRLGDGLVASIAVGGTHLRSWPPTQGPGPAVSQFNTGDREVDFVAEHGSQALDALYRDARDELVEWASTWLDVAVVSGLAGVDEVWRHIADGQSNPLAATIIRP
jgi:hypothetical protein